MNRRDLLRKSTASAVLLSVSGCLDIGGFLGTGGCASRQPLSATLQEGGGSTDACTEGATASLGIESERKEPITATVKVESGSGSEVIGETYSLEPGERAVESNAIPAHDDHTVSVSVGQEDPVSGSWDGVSCLGHGIAVQTDHVEIGYIELYGGRADGNHNCNAGDGTAFVIFNRPDDPTPQTVHVQIQNKCTNEKFKRTVDIAPDDFVQISDPLKIGDEVNVSVEVDGGGSDTQEFSGLCGGFSAGIQDDGDIRLSHQIA